MIQRHNQKAVLEYSTQQEQKIILFSGAHGIFIKLCHNPDQITKVDKLYFLEIMESIFSDYNRINSYL